MLLCVYALLLAEKGKGAHGECWPRRNGTDGGHLSAHDVNLCCRFRYIHKALMFILSWRHASGSRTFRHGKCDVSPWVTAERPCVAQQGSPGPATMNNKKQSQLSPMST